MTNEPIDNSSQETIEIIEIPDDEPRHPRKKGEWERQNAKARHAGNGSGHSRKKGKKKVWRVLLIILCVLLLLIGGMVGAFFGLYSKGKSSLTEDKQQIPVDIQTVYYNGRSYVYDEDVVSVLFLGVDKTDIQSEDGYGLNGQADSLFVFSLNTRTGATHVIPLSRETMVDVDVYTVGGSYSGVEKKQLCLAYSYGNSGEDSAANVVRSVERILNGVHIDAFVAVDLEGLHRMTDMIGGVSLTPIETFHNGKTWVYKDQETLLDGQHAELYIRYRDDDVDANNRRMKRQKQFLNAFAGKAKEQIASNFTLVTKYYNTAKPYIVSDLSLSEITYMASRIITVSGGLQLDYLSITGETVMGEKYVEFYPEESSVFEAVLTAFYKETSEQPPAGSSDVPAVTEPTDG